MTDVVRSARLSTLRPAKQPQGYRWFASVLAVVAVCGSTVAFSSRPATASSLATEKAQAATLYQQIQNVNSKVGRLGQKFDQTKIKLSNISNQIKNTKAAVATIKNNVVKGNNQLRNDAIFAFVTNGSAASNNPLFTSNASKIGATNVYNELAQGNISTTLASLKNYKIELTQQRGILKGEMNQAGAATRFAATSLHQAKILQSGLQSTLHQIKGKMATYVAQEAAAATAKSAVQLQSAAPIPGFAAPPADSRANIAVDAALSYRGVWYQWGGASRAGVDCSGLVMLAYDAAGIYLPHYSGAQWADTMRVPLADIQPGDLLFYGYHGDEHVAMYVGGGQMVEAEMTGTQVHVVPIRLGYGFAGLGRPRA